MGENTDYQAAAEEASKQGTFNLVDRLVGRNMPTEDVVIYLDEKTGFEILRLDKQHADTTDKGELKKLEAKREHLVKTLEKSKYTFTLQGLTTENYDKIIDQIREAYPSEYEDSVNPLTGQKLRLEVPNELRDELYHNLLLAACLVKVADPDGNLDEDISVEKASIIRRITPIDGVRRITKTIDDLRMLSEWMDGVQSADF